MPIEENHIKDIIKYVNDQIFGVEKPTAHIKVFDRKFGVRFYDFTHNNLLDTINCETNNQPKLLAQLQQKQPEQGKKKISNLSMQFK